MRPLRTRIERYNMTTTTISRRDGLMMSRSIADVDAVLSLLRRQADVFRVRSALDAAARSIDTCRQKALGPVAQRATARALLDLSSLRDRGEIELAPLAAILQRLRDAIRRLRLDAGLLPAAG